jgi:Flp pilus assembly protein CpaB
MRPLRRFRLFVARRPLVYWLLVGSLAAAAGGVVVARTAAADAARRRWGQERLVVVAGRDLRPGEVLGPADARVERWPLALAPADALSGIEGGEVVAAPIVRGEPVVRHRLGRSGAGPVAGLLPLGTRGVVVTVGEPPLPVHPGDRVDVVATDPAGDGVVVAMGAMVVRVDDQGIVIAVGLDQVAAVAGAVAGGSAVLVVDGDPPAP